METLGKDFFALSTVGLTPTKNLATDPPMSFVKPVLPYKYDELEPYIDTKTMKMHYEVHHSAYINNLSGIEDKTVSNSGLCELIMNITTNDKISLEEKKILINHGGGHYNHSLFWQFMTPQSKSLSISISSQLLGLINKDFGNIKKFQEDFKAKSLSVFGSGWCWWVFDTEKHVSFIETTKDQYNPIMNNSKLVCLLGLDVWEHAYYLNFQANRGEYIDNWWNVVNWGVVSRIYNELAINGKQVYLMENGWINFN